MWPFCLLGVSVACLLQVRVLPMRSTVPTANPPPVCKDKKTIISVTYRHCLTLNQNEVDQILLPLLSLPVWFFLQQALWPFMVGKSQMLLITVMTALLYSGVPLSHDNELNSRTLKLKLLSGIKYLYISLCTRVFSTATCHEWTHKSQEVDIWRNVFINMSKFH